MIETFELGFELVPKRFITNATYYSLNFAFAKIEVGQSGFVKVDNG